MLTSLCKQIWDYPRHLGVHVGGMIITGSPLVEVIPLERARKEGIVVTQVDKDDIADLGLIKTDLLSLATLSLLVVTSYTCTVLKPGLISGLSGGLLRLLLEYEGAADPDWPRTLILKANPSDTTVHEHMVAGARQRGLDSLLPLMPNLGFNRREVMSYRYLPDRIPIGMPAAYHTVLDEPGNRLWIFMEDIGAFDMLDSWDDLSAWDDARLQHVVRDLAEFHATWWGQTGEWKSHDWLIRSDPPFWSEYVHAALSANTETHPSFITQARLPLLERLADAVPRITEELRQQPQTLIHGDCTPRNACFRPLPNGSRLVLYDWALTSIRPPQQDLAKFLLFVLDPGAEMSRLRGLLDE